MKKISALIFSGATYLSLATHSFAATDDPPAENTPISVNPCPSDAANEGGFNVLCDLKLGGGLFQDIITTAFIIASLIALAFLVYGGIKWIMSGGDKGGVETARNIIVASLVGLVITFLSYLFINIIFGFFGLDFGTFQLPVFTDNIVPEG